MERKEKLIKALGRAIHSLKNDIVSYNWFKQTQCNCGIVLQSILGVDKETLQEYWDSEVKKIQDDKFKKNPTWKGMIKSTCSATGIPTRGVLKMLYSEGITPEDMVHLEFMSNEAILEVANINKTNTTKRKPNGTKYKVVPSTTFFGRIFGLTKKVEDGVEYEEETIFYYQQKENLIKYLSAWKKILSEEIPINADDKISLEKQLLQAVANENYILAADIRDRLN